MKKGHQSLGDILHKAIKHIETLKANENQFSGVPSGLSDLDRLTGGWQKSDLVIVAGRPGMGKTAFVVSIARNAAIDFGKAVALFSLEMSSIQLVTRLISSESEIASEKIRKGDLKDFEWEQLRVKTERLAEAPIFIDDTPALSIFELRAKCRRLKAQHDIQLVVIDYLQLMTAGGEGKGNREQEISMISRSLKSIAKELNIDVVYVGIDFHKKYIQLEKNRKVNENWNILSVTKITLTKNIRIKMFAATINKNKNFLIKS